MRYEKGVLQNFPKFTRKHLCQGLFLTTLIKKETLAQVFSCEFYEIFKNNVLTEQLRASELKTFLDFFFQ